MKNMTLPVGQLSIEQAFQLLTQPLQLDEPTRHRIQTSADYVQTVVEAGEVVYGINTGFGQLANQRIATSELKKLQHHLILSHAIGIGAPLPDEIVKLILLLKINSLAAGYSGVSVALVDRLCTLFNASVCPLIPTQGSVGASGDLAPLAHMACTLLGVGSCRVEGKNTTAMSMLKQLGHAPFELGPKEGLALINGTQASTAIAVTALKKTKVCFETALISGALSVEAACGSVKPFDEKIHAVRGQTGQMQVAALLQTLLADSPIVASHANCEKVQDPYSLRCQPQVMGAVWDQCHYAKTCLEREMNAVTDNPLVFAETQQILSGGNFHAQSVGFAADALAMAIAEIGSLAERRIALLMDHQLSGLPAFLTPNPGLNSGLMIAQVTAAALASENKSLCFPTSVDNIPTSANQEDHVSMATHGAWRLHRMLDNLSGILGIELMAAYQGVKLRKAPSAPRLQYYLDVLAQHFNFLAEDRWLAPELNAIMQAVFSEAFTLEKVGIHFNY